MMTIVGERHLAIVDTDNCAVNRWFETLLQVVDLRIHNPSQQVEFDTSRGQPGQTLQSVFERGLEQGERSVEDGQI